MRLITLLLVLSLTSACGLRGPLYMPKDEGAVSSEQTNKPAESVNDTLKKNETGTVADKADDLSVSSQ